MRSRGCSRTWHGIPKGSEHTAPGDPAAKLCGMPLNVDVEKENVLLTRRGGRGGVEFSGYFSN